MRRVAAALDEPTTTPSEQIALINHYLEIGKWILPPGEFERKVELPAWDLVWENADRFVELFEAGLAKLDLTDEERADMEHELDRARVVVEHKRMLEGLNDAGDDAPDD